MAGQHGHFQFPATALQIVGHIQDHKRRQAETQNRGTQHQMSIQICGVKNQQDRVGLADIGIQSMQNVMGNQFIFRAWGQTIHTRKIHNADFLFGIQNCPTNVVFHSDAREIGHLLAQPGESVKKGGFSRVRWANQRHSVKVTCI